MSDRLDQLGAVASSLCAVHCAVCALLPAAFGVLGAGVLLGHGVEWGFTLVAVAFAAGALVVGWRRHGSVRVAAFFVAGIVGLLASRGLEAGEPHAASAHGAEVSAHHDADDHSGRHTLGAGLGILAGGLLVVGHALNLRASRRCARGCA